MWHLDVSNRSINSYKMGGEASLDPTCSTGFESVESGGLIWFVYSMAHYPNAGGHQATGNALFHSSLTPHVHQ